MEIIKNKQISQLNEIPLKFDRLVHLNCLGKLRCVAESIIEVSDEKIISLIVDKKIGIGQIFRHLNILPEFELQSASRLEDGGIERIYTLKMTGLICYIKEKFPPNLLGGEDNSLDSINMASMNKVPKYTGPQ